MNVEHIRKKLEEYQLMASPRQVVREYEKMGVEFKNIKPRNLEKKYKMRNDLIRKMLDETPPEIKERVRKYADDLERIETIVDEAYKLYMPQVRSEITDLCRLLVSHFKYPPSNILEIGTKYGGTFYLWNKLWEPQVLEQGVVSKTNCISIDLSDGGIHGGVSEEEMDQRDLWFYERFPNCHFIRGDSHEWRTYNRFSAILNPKETFEQTQIFNQLDFLFIDGDHSYEGVKKDFEMYSRFVKKNGIICLHDINDSERHRERNVFVSKFWQEMKDDPKFDSFEINAGENWAGLGICIKL